MSSLAGAVREGLGLKIIRFAYRLDRETSGVIILAKDELTGTRLGKAVLKRRIGKAYITLVEGELTAPVAVNQPLGPDLTTNVSVKSRVVPAGTEGSQEAHTVFHPLIAQNGFTLAGVELLTGRKHQIRAHAEWLGHRVVGDKTLWPRPDALPGICHPWMDDPALGIAADHATGAALRGHRLAAGRHGPCVEGALAGGSGAVHGTAHGADSSRGPTID